MGTSILGCWRELPHKARRNTNSGVKGIEQHPGESRKEWMLQLRRRVIRIPTTGAFSCGARTTGLFELRDTNRLYQKLNYLHHNPVEAGCVEREEEGLYSSARNYHGLPGLIEVTLLEPQVLTVT